MKSLIFILVFLSSNFVLSKENPKIVGENLKIYAPLKGSTVTAGQGVFKNSTNKPVKLEVQSSKLFKVVELHKSMSKNGMMRMEKLDSLQVPAGSTLVLAPGGYHLMLFHPTKELKIGDLVPIILKVNGQNQEFMFKIISRM